jgi:hypothetical protein
MAQTANFTFTRDDPAATEALEWLAGQLRWERILDRLHREADGVAPLVAVTDDEEAGDRAA